MTTPKKAHGQIRRSQVVTTFGPGALVDLPKHSVIIGGLDFWLQAEREEVLEPRMVEKLKRVLEVPNLKLFAPPPENDDFTGPQTGITAWQFPEWFITQDVEGEQTPTNARSRMLVHRSSLTKGKFIDWQKKRRAVVPVRFVRACPNGHIGDIDWKYFVHEGRVQCGRPLWIDEYDTSGDLSRIMVRCECGAMRPVGQAALVENRVLGICDGSRPWLGRYAPEQCSQPNRLLTRTASNAYFPQVLSVISLPDRDSALSQAVEAVWTDLLEYAETMEDLQSERRRKPRVKEALEGFADEDVLQEILSRKRGGSTRLAKSVKQAEFETLISCGEHGASEQSGEKFFAQILPRTAWGCDLLSAVERVVLVRRLREVVAQVGFTRFEAQAPDIEGELAIGVKRADLAREVSWLPAIENHGEGFFIGFHREAVQEWVGRQAVLEHGKRLKAGFDQWKAERHGSKREFFGLPYTMLHSLSHLLITTVSLECGYPASSIRERIYSLESGYGILLYTGSADSEGTLGGLVEVGKHVRRHIEAALDLGRLCSNDPVCAQHNPSDPHERRFLHGAACHGCVLIAETSCEQQNDFLDRALVVPTVENLGVEFFNLA